MVEGESFSDPRYARSQSCSRSPRGTGTDPPGRVGSPLSTTGHAAHCEEGTIRSRASHPQELGLAQVTFTLRSSYTQRGTRQPARGPPDGQLGLPTEQTKRPHRAQRSHRPRGQRTAFTTQGLQAASTRSTGWPTRLTGGPDPPSRSSPADKRCPRGVACASTGPLNRRSHRAQRSPKASEKTRWIQAAHQRSELHEQTMAQEDGHLGLPREQSHRT